MKYLFFKFTWKENNNELVKEFYLQTTKSSIYCCLTMYA